MSKLMLGGGHETRHLQAQGWTVIDAFLDWRADYVQEVPPLPKPVFEQKWEIVKAIHFIEHLFLADAGLLIRQIYEVLADNGLLILEQANLERVMRFTLGDEQPPIDKPAYAWMKGDESWFGMRSLYPQPDQMSGNFLNVHRHGYTPASLIELVVAGGFDADNVTISKARSHVPERDLRLEARK